LLGCYSFPAHVGTQHPEIPLGIALPTLLESLREEFPSATITHVAGTTIDGFETDGFAAAQAAAKDADVAIVVLGDRAGLFGRGTSGEGCDAESLVLPGTQQQLLDSVLDTGTPVVLTLMSGRPYALGRGVTESAAIVQTFFPGEEGAPAIAGVLSGRVSPSGRLPVSVPAHPGAQPSTYLAAPLARRTDVSNIDPTAAFPFGHGLSYTTFALADLRAERETLSTDGDVGISFSVSNTGTRAGTEIVQLYLHDPVASVVRPVQRLIGYCRVSLKPGERAEFSARVPADITSFTSKTGARIVEPGEIVLGLGTSSRDIPLSATVMVTGETRQVGPDRAFHASFSRVG
ncbi:MAG: glycoside hydrolase family 3 C-terminal domain-containing protein, partial [Glaciihabitans sp.]